MHPEANQIQEAESMKGNARAKRIWLLVALVVVCVVVFAVHAGRLLVVDAPERSDVILVLAGETNLRPVRALALLDQGYARRVVIDVPRAARIYNSTEVELAQKYIQTLPQAASIEVCPIDGLSTRDESHDAERCLAHEPGNRILIVTSDFHTRRALSIFRHEIRDKSFSVAASRDDASFGVDWWKHRQWAKFFFDEWLRVLWWNGIERWR